MCLSPLLCLYVCKPLRNRVAAIGHDMGPHINMGSSRGIVCITRKGIYGPQNVLVTIVNALIIVQIECWVIIREEVVC